MKSSVTIATNVQVAIEMTQAERLQKVEDDRNITIHVISLGDGDNYPLSGDIVRVRYTCTLPNGKTGSILRVLRLYG